MIYLLMSIVGLSTEDAQLLIVDLRTKVAQCRNAPAPFLWSLITNVPTLRIEDPPRVWKMTRCLFVMSKLTRFTQGRLDHILLQAVSQALDFSLCDSNGTGVVRLDGLDFDTLETDILKDLELASRTSDAAGRAIKGVAVSHDDDA